MVIAVNGPSLVHCDSIIKVTIRQLRMDFESIYALKMTVSLLINMLTSGSPGRLLQ